MTGDLDDPPASNVAHVDNLVNGAVEPKKILQSSVLENSSGENYQSSAEKINADASSRAPSDTAAQEESKALARSISSNMVSLSITDDDYVQVNVKQESLPAQISPQDNPLNSPDHTLSPSSATDNSNHSPNVLVRSDSDRSLSSATSGNDEFETEFLLSRLEAANKSLEADSRTLTFDRIAAQQHEFEERRNSSMGMLEEKNHDWDFWGKAVTDYESLVKWNTRQLTRNIKSGIPTVLRGLMWQIMCRSKDFDLEVTYRALLKKSSPFEKLITRDLGRTFPKHPFFQEGGPGQTALFNVMKAYSLYDPECGYCQGLSFVVGPLLLNMPEEEAFCVLVRLMKAYEMRGHYTPKMEALELRLYQFDRLLEEQLPAVARHLNQEGVKSSMYASQWFMTIYAYRFPLDIVFRIFDVLLAEGIEVLHRIGIALMKRNADQIMALEFETLLPYLKDGLFDVYYGDPKVLINDAYKISISKKKIDKLAKDWEEERKKFTDEMIEIESLRSEKRELQDTIIELRKERDDAIEKSIGLEVQVDNLKHQTEHFKSVIKQLEEQLNDFKSYFTDQRRSAEALVADEMQAIVTKNIKVTKQLVESEERVSELENSLVKKSMDCALLEEENHVLKMELDHYKKNNKI